jgi:hypothetical protein
MFPQAKNGLAVETITYLVRSSPIKPSGEGVAVLGSEDSAARSQTCPLP